MHQKVSTAEIAQAIGKELQAAGNSADAVEIVKGASMQGYNAIMIGGPMYMGRTDGSARKFVERHMPENLPGWCRLPDLLFVLWRP